MVNLPTVKSFLGCIDLKIACIVIAAFRMAVAIFLLIVLFVICFFFQELLNNDSETESNKEASQIFTIIFVIYLIIVVPLIFINILCSYWFIQGATSNNPTKMKYYIIIEGINIVLMLMRFDSSLLTTAAIEFYFLVCSNSLYQERLMASSQENEGVNTTENTVIEFHKVPSPPPMYNSSENVMQPQNVGMYSKINP